jgi:steroid delta-isomerase-like uncharacterized protein
MLTSVRGLIEQWYYRMWNTWDASVIPDIVHTDLRFRGSLGAEKIGHSGLIEYIGMVRSAFPDFTNQIDDLVLEPDKGFAKLTYTGTHRGTIFGIPATGRPIRYAGAALFTVTQGKIATVWVLGDLHGLLQQLK